MFARTFLFVVAYALGRAQTVQLPPDVDPVSLSRLPVKTRDQLDGEGKRVLDYIAGKDRDSAPMGPAAVSIYSPAVAEPLQQLNQYLRKTVVGSHFFEICALVAAREYDQVYEWTGHEPGALRAGVDQSVIDAIKFNRDLKGLPEKDATVIQYGRDLFHRHRVSPELYAKVVAMFGRDGMIELTAVLGDFAMVGLMLNAADQHLPADRKPLLTVP